MYERGSLGGGVLFAECEGPGSSGEAQELMLERNALREENARLRQQTLKLTLRLEHEQERVALYHLLRDEQVRSYQEYTVCGG